MMKIFLLFSALFCFSLINAQDEIYTNGVFDFEENSPHKIFAKGTLIRKNPDIKASITDTLNSNHDIFVERKTDSKFMFGARSAHWYKISYKKNGAEKSGYVWGANLCVGYRSRNGKDFLFGLNPSELRTSKESGEKFFQNIGSVKVMSGNVLLNEAFFDTGFGEELSTKSFTIEEGKGLSNVEYVVKAHVSGEACGIGSYDHFLLYGNDSLVALPNLVNVGDADVYHHSEEYIFPSDKGGKPGKILFKMKEMEKDEKEKEHYKRSSKTYTWDGKKLIGG